MLNSLSGRVRIPVRQGDVHGYMITGMGMSDRNVYACMMNDYIYDFFYEKKSENISRDSMNFMIFNVLVSYV